MRWIEINIGLKYEKPFLNEVLINHIKPLIERNRDRICSWHFLWEPKPWPELTGKGITLRLRFLGEESTIAILRSDLDAKFLSLENQFPNSYLGHCFGKHGDCGQEYDGEVECWGTEGWKFGMDVLRFASDTALELIEDRDKLGRSEEYKKNIDFYADRYVHLFFNMLETMPLFDESEFLLSQAVSRSYYKSFGEQIPQEILMKIKRLTQQEIARSREVQ